MTKQTEPGSPGGEGVPLDAVALHFKRQAEANERRVRELTNEGLALAVALREQSIEIARLTAELEAKHG